MRAEYYLITENMCRGCHTSGSCANWRISMHELSQCMNCHPVITYHYISKPNGDKDLSVKLKLQRAQRIQSKNHNSCVLCG